MDGKRRNEMAVQNMKAFTMLELLFVIVIIGILSSIAIPRFATTRDSAQIVKAKSTIAAIQNVLITERQKKILKGDFSNFTSLGGTTGNNADLFDYFDGNVTHGRILETPITSCISNTSIGCWKKISDTQYQYIMPLKGGVAITFTFDGKSRFTCDSTLSGDAGRYCKELTR